MTLIIKAFQGYSEVFVLLNTGIHDSEERIRPYIKHQNPTVGVHDQENDSCAKRLQNSNHSQNKI